MGSKKKNIPIVGLSHQSAFLSKKTPRPTIKDPFAEWLFHNYAPVKKYVGFHFESYDKNIFTPVIRTLIREATPQDKGHYTVYLPAYGDEKLVKWLSRFNKIRWHIFSKHCRKAYFSKNMNVYPVSGLSFVESIVNSTGVLCGAGFETPAEVLYLQKKLLVVPMQNQYEQQCNGVALKKMGVPRIKKLNRKSLKKVMNWLDTDKIQHFKFPIITSKAVDHVIEKATMQS